MKDENIIIRYAHYSDFEKVYKFLDNNFTKEGYGFLHKSQIETEIMKSRVIIAVHENDIVGTRIGIGKLWNMSVSKEYRGKSIGRRLIEFYKPDVIRVKSNPVGHLSKHQKENFVNPEGFYEKLGYKMYGYDYGKNFYAGEKDGKRIHIQQGEKKHIKIYVKDEEVFLFGEYNERNM
jgi:GNAT superfamily N-acetyltransferase